MWNFTNKMFTVHKTLFISVIVGLLTLNAQALENEQKIISVTQNIKYLSQKIANDYLHLYHNKKKIEIKDKLKSSIKELEDNFRFIAKNSNNTDTKNVLDFLSYNKDQMRETLENKISKDSASSMLDLSNTLLEGAMSIQNGQEQDKFESKFHLMMISKLYMAINLDFDKTANTDEIKKKIESFDSSFATNNSWIAFKDILQNNQKCFTPNIVSILIKDLEEHENYN